MNDLSTPPTRTTANSETGINNEELKENLEGFRLIRYTMLPRIRTLISWVEQYAGLFGEDGKADPEKFRELGIVEDYVESLRTPKSSKYDYELKLIKHELLDFTHVGKETLMKQLTTVEEIEKYAERYKETPGISKDTILKWIDKLLKKGYDLENTAVSNTVDSFRKWSQDSKSSNHIWPFLREFNVRHELAIMDINNYDLNFPKFCKQLSDLQLSDLQKVDRSSTSEPIYLMLLNLNSKLNTLHPKSEHHVSSIARVIQIVLGDAIPDILERPVFSHGASCKQLNSAKGICKLAPQQCPDMVCKKVRKFFKEEGAANGGVPHFGCTEQLQFVETRLEFQRANILVRWLCETSGKTPKTETLVSLQPFPSTEAQAAEIESSKEKDLGKILRDFENNDTLDFLRKVVDLLHGYAERESEAAQGKGAPVELKDENGMATRKTTVFDKEEVKTLKVLSECVRRLSSAMTTSGPYKELSFLFNTTLVRFVEANAPSTCHSQVACQAIDLLLEHVGQAVNNIYGLKGRGPQWNAKKWEFAYRAGGYFYQYWSEKGKDPVRSDWKHLNEYFNELYIVYKGRPVEFEQKHQQPKDILKQVAACLISVDHEIQLTRALVGELRTILQRDWKNVKSHANLFGDEFTADPAPTNALVVRKK